ncbi:unnamed protein product [Adineta ricciae]|uniref:B box-type domain-containing protein n=1 Tax=Adineta ricciae TaxID=249248 RepID=A0A814KN70_ADIRI|nr:unnamed protein product [Adineta ricciae]
MTSSNLKKPCAKCNKNTSILTCDGCQQSFCAKHISDHRQDLSVEMDNIGQEYDLLRRDLVRDDNDHHLLFNRIHLWEERSINQIHQIAQQARFDLRQYLDTNKSQITNICNKLTEDLHSSRESGDYTETDFHLWIERLRELRKMLENPPIIEIFEDENISTAIRMIQVRDKTDQQFCHSSDQQLQPCRPSLTTIAQTFENFIGHATFAENHLVAKHSGDCRRSTMVYLTTSYASGTSNIRFQIEKKTNKLLFIGIIDSFEQMTRSAFKSPSLYGWVTPHVRIVQSEKIGSSHLHETFSEGDEISLTLNCDQHQIILEHYRTKTIDQFSIDSRVCSLPWRVVVAFFTPSDSIRLLC